MKYTLNVTVVTCQWKKKNRECNWKLAAFFTLVKQQDKTVQENGLRKYLLAITEFLV